MRRVGETFGFLQSVIIKHSSCNFFPHLMAKRIEEEEVSKLRLVYAVNTAMRVNPDISSSPPLRGLDEISWLSLETWLRVSVNIIFLSANFHLGNPFFQPTGSQSDNHIG